MKAICTNGLVIECGNFKAIDGGVILTEDVKRKRPIGFVPTGTLRYVLPDEVADDADAAEKASDVAAGAVDLTERAHERPRSGETDVPSPAQRRTVTRLRDRLDRIEAAVELSQADNKAGSSRSASDSASDARATSDADADADSDVLRVTGGDGPNGDTESVTADDAERESGTEVEPEEPIADDEREDADDLYPDLQRVDGLGPTYAGRLHNEGIETLADLEAADPEEVATIADVGTTRAEDWIIQAGEQT